jgi:hypothetical protein
MSGYAVLADIDSVLRTLAASPHIGHRRPDLTARPLRFHIVRDEYLLNGRKYVRSWRSSDATRCGSGDSAAHSDRVHARDRRRLSPSEPTIECGAPNGNRAGVLDAARDEEDTGSFSARTLKWREAGLIADEVVA